MTEKWTAIIDAISIVKPESVNADRIKQMLDYDWTVDAQVLDNLYILKVLTLEEYKSKMSSCIKWHKDIIKKEKERLQAAYDRGEDYDPMAFYGFGAAYRGAAIENEIHKG